MNKFPCAGYYFNYCNYLGASTSLSFICGNMNHSHHLTSVFTGVKYFVPFFNKYIALINRYVHFYLCTVHNMQFLHFYDLRSEIWKKDEAEGWVEVERLEAGPGVSVRVICQDKLCDPRLGAAGDNPARWNRERNTRWQAVVRSVCVVCFFFLWTDVSVYQFSVSRIRLSVSDAAAVK